MLNDQIWNWIAGNLDLGEALTATDKINLLIALVTALGALGTMAAAGASLDRIGFRIVGRALENSVPS
jgi:hypothetical protein